MNFRETPGKIGRVGMSELKCCTIIAGSIPARAPIVTFFTIVPG
jgi:hypothetical protein